MTTERRVRLFETMPKIEQPTWADPLNATDSQHSGTFMLLRSTLNPPRYRHDCYVLQNEA